MTTGLVLVSHSALLAGGVVELAEQMAPDVVLRPAGGTDDARLGTSFDVVERAIAAELDAGCTAVVILADIGSARMTAEAVVEALEDPRIVLAPGAFVEGAVAAAVAAQGGADAAGVAAAVAVATRQVAAELADPEPDPVAAPPAASTTIVPDLFADSVSRTVLVRNPQGLHARPASQVTTLVGGFDAHVTLNGAKAASLLAIMALGLTQDSEVLIEATGPEAAQALEAVAAAFEGGCGGL